MIFTAAKNMAAALVALSILVLASPSIVFANEDTSWAKMYFMRGDGGSAPNIARELYRFNRDGWIDARTRQPQVDNNEPFWGLPPTIGPSDDLTYLLEHLAPEGSSRAQTGIVLDTAQHREEDFDTAIAAGDYVWQRAGWANILQVKIGAYVLYVAFYTDYQGTPNVPVDGAIVRNPFFADDAPETILVMSQAAKFAAEGDYARCVQSTVGVDIDGAVGPGTRRVAVAKAVELGLDRIVTDAFLRKDTNLVVACRAFLAVELGLDNVAVSETQATMVNFTFDATQARRSGNLKFTVVGHTVVAMAVASGGNPDFLGTFNQNVLYEKGNQQPESAAAILEWIAEPQGNNLTWLQNWIGGKPDELRPAIESGDYVWTAFGMERYGLTVHLPESRFHFYGIEKGEVAHAATFAYDDFFGFHAAF